MCADVNVFVLYTGSDFVDPDDPTVIAENELLGAAKSIEAAAKKLMQLKPRASAKVNYFLNSQQWYCVGGYL